MVGCGVAGLGCEVTAHLHRAARYGTARAAAIATLPGLVARGGTWLVIARATDDEAPPRLRWRAGSGGG